MNSQNPPICEARKEAACFYSSHGQIIIFFRSSNIFYIAFLYLFSSCFEQTIWAEFFFITEMSLYGLIAHLLDF